MIDATTINDATTMRGASGSALGHIDQYELVRELGGGGFGTVYLAKDTVAGIDVAVKGLPPMIKNNAEELERIRENFALVSKLHHPYIAAALHLQLARDVAYRDESVKQKLRVLPGDTLMVMEYAPGVTLSKWRKQFPGGIVPLDVAIQLAWQIAQALDYAHEQHIIHRDIKPSNIMVETKPDGEVVARLLDFGLAAEIRSSMGRVSQEVHDTSGTRPYMAPEQWAGRKQGPATDQYALAVLLCELLTGEVPFASVFETGDPIVMMTAVCNRAVELPEGCPRQTALRRALAKEPEGRFASCMEFVETAAKRCRWTSENWGAISLLKRFASWMLLPIKNLAHAFSATIGIIVEKGLSKIPVIVISKLPLVVNLLVLAACIALLYMGYRVIVPAKYESVLADVSPSTLRLACEKTEQRAKSPTEQFVDESVVPAPPCDRDRAKSPTEQFIDACNEGNYEEAARFQSSVDQNDVNVQFWLGYMYEKGIGFTRNDVAAARWYEAAAKQGHSTAQNNLGVMYADGRGVTKNDLYAARWYRMAAYQGNLAMAQYNLGVCYANGVGVERDKDEAVKWCRKAAEQGLAVAQNDLGLCYENGDGISKDEVEAVKWYRKAAEQGNEEAKENLKRLGVSGN